MNKIYHLQAQFESIRNTLLILIVAFAFVGSVAAQGNLSGELRSGDDTLSSGEFADGTEFSASEGDWISVIMTSSDFDPYVILKPPSCPKAGTCERQLDIDDIQSGDDRALLVTRVSEAGTWTVLATSSRPGETGSYQLAIDVDDDISDVESLAFFVLGADQIRHESGSLDLGDKTLDSGEYVDNFAFIGRAGQAVTIDMTSPVLNPYVILSMPDKSQVDNDDWEESRRHSRIETVLPLDGLYRVSATSFAPGERGRYEVEIRSEIPFVKD